MVNEALQGAAGFLRAEQRPYGGFPSYVYRDGNFRGKGHTDEYTLFETTFVIYALVVAEIRGCEDVMDRAAAFLLRQRDRRGLFRFWADAGTSRADCDLDDTCCVSWVVKTFTSMGSDLGNTDEILRNRRPDGLFETWVREGDVANDADAVVNANVLLYLGERAETLAVVSWLRDLLSRGPSWGSYWYYVDAVALDYAASRALAHGCTSLNGVRADIVARLRKRRRLRGSFGHELATGMAVCALANCGLSIEDEAVRDGVEVLLGSQRADGSWGRRAFYAGPEPPERHQIWWGSEALTTALCVEALAKSVNRTWRAVETRG